MVLLIFQWNAISFIANGQELKKCFSDLENKPDIICVQETWLKPQFKFALQGYVVIRKDRKKVNGVGVATFIKQGVGYRNVEVSVDKEVVVMEVWEVSHSIKVIHFYNSCQSLKIIDCAVIRSNIEYGSVVYSSANKTLLKKIEVIQKQALRICCGEFRSSQVASLQVEIEELPLEQRKLQLRLRYWSGVKGHLENHPVRLILKDRWEYQYKEMASFGWVVRKEANSLELKDHEVAPSVAIPAISPWLFPVIKK